MAQIRVFITSNDSGIEARLPALLKHAEAVRNEPGCVQFEYFRGIEFPENFVQLELWEDAASFDAHWRRPIEAGVSLIVDNKYLQAPFHYGTPESPRRHGQNSIEFYQRTTYANVDGYFVADDPALRVDSIRWPSWSAVRYIMQSTADPGAPGQSQAYFDESRAEEGCLQFEPYRSLEFPENMLTLELWSTPETIEKHTIYRQVQRKFGLGSGPVASRATPPERRYGVGGREWYPQCRYELTGDIWVPEEQSQRMSVIRWT